MRMSEKELEKLKQDLLKLGIDMIKYSPDVSVVKEIEDGRVLVKMMVHGLVIIDKEAVDWVANTLTKVAIAQPCCWYCANRHNCEHACINDPVTCTFCAWMLDEECKDFKLDAKEFVRLMVKVRKEVNG